MKAALVRYWKWVVAAAGLLGFIAWALLKEFFQGKPVDPVIEQRKIDEEYARKVEVLEVKEQTALEDVREKHDADLKAVDQKIEDRTEKIEDDPKAVNDFLKDLGKDVRG